LSYPPLTGVRVLDLTRLLPGGICTLRLAELGAEVLKVEQPGQGDYARAREPHYDGVDPTTTSASFIGLNRGKKSIVLDLKTEAERERFLELVEEADVVIDSFRPGVLSRLRLDYDHLRRCNRRIVHCSLSGWGQDGPMAQVAGHDINYLAEIGLLSLTGESEEEPCLPPVQIADCAGALIATTSVLAALHQREQSDEGCFLDVSLAHSALSLFPMGVAAALSGAPVRPRHRNLFSGGVVCYRAYRCRDGWVALGALEERFWHTWCDGVDRPDLRDCRYEDFDSPTGREVTAIFAARTKAEWRSFARRHDCCLTVVRGLEEALASPLVRDRGMIAEVRQPGIEDPVEVLGGPWQDDAATEPAPSLGSHRGFE
jgi:alpha-methylacyl-CoA racemase